MKVAEIRTESGLEKLQPVWNGLLENSASKTIFLTWEWVSAWWSAYGTPGELRVLTATEEDGTLLGIAPLRRRAMSRYGQTAEAYAFVGDGSNDSEYLDCIVAAGHEDPVMEAFGRHCAEELAKGGVLTLNEVPASSPNLAWFRRWAGPKSIFKEPEHGCATLHFPATWEGYVSTLKPRFRTRVRSVLRDLEGRPEVRLGFCRTPQDVERLLPILYDLHQRRWQQDGKPGVFGWDRKRDFYQTLSPVLLERGWLRFSWLEWNGRVLACQYGFAYGGTYFHLQEGYEPASEHLSIGVGLRAWSMREMLNEGIREYDFLGGVNRHKSDWGAVAKQSTDIQIARSSYKNLVLLRGPEWEESARESMKKVVPESILAARRARLERRSAEIAKPSLADRSRQGAANCYYHLGLPALTRPLRDQFRLSLSTDGRLPKLSWNRRQEASGRILYFHRVNEDRDPFFPAISTQLFEQEMRFIARHYKVVPLGELLNRLEDDAREPVMAITFDDGYQDNYQNAFPILQRYGLPATIFLATGSLDSREPLWFEQLALALKKTSLSHIDLETDIPRRFFMNTMEERLKSNSRIFALLRLLPDTERRQWLERILKQLAVNGDQTRWSKMLTWDEVRLMKRHGIDFGGHTVTHPFLSKLTREQMTWEVSECKRRIEQELQLPADHFAYPNGREEDFGAWNKEVVREAGYKAAVTTLWGMNYRSTDRMELRRGGPWEESRALFAYKLDWYQLVDA